MAITIKSHSCKNVPLTTAKRCQKRTKNNRYWNYVPIHIIWYICTIVYIYISQLKWWVKIGRAQLMGQLPGAQTVP